MATLRSSDHPTLLVSSAVSAPVAAGLLWAGATAANATAAVVAAVFLVAWLLIALPVAVLVGRFMTRHVHGLDEEGDR